jgi:hypothetical protein
VELWGPPYNGGPIPPSKHQIQNTHENFWLFEAKLLNSTFKASNSNHPQNILLFVTTLLNCLVIWNWVLTSTAWCCNLHAKQLDLQKGSKKNHVNWNYNIHVTNYNIHVTYNLCSCKHQVPCEEYKLEMFALNNLIFTSHNFWEPYQRWEKRVIVSLIY